MFDIILKNEFTDWIRKVSQGPFSNRASVPLVVAGFPRRAKTLVCDACGDSVRCRGNTRKSVKSLRLKHNTDRKAFIMRLTKEERVLWRWRQALSREKRMLSFKQDEVLLLLGHDIRNKIKMFEVKEPLKSRKDLIIWSWSVTTFLLSTYGCIGLKVSFFIRWSVSSAFIGVVSSS